MAARRSHLILTKDDTKLASVLQYWPLVLIVLIRDAGKDSEGTDSAVIGQNAEPGQKPDCQAL